MENQNRLLLIVTLAAVVIGGVTLWVQYEAKSKKPVTGWYNLGTETFDLKPNAHRGFSYRELPGKLRIEVSATEPLDFGFVTPDTFGHYNSTPMQLDFASLPCGASHATKADVNCTTESDKRYLLLTDLREDAIPESATRTAKLQKAAADAPTTLPDNHVTVKMYDWRCLQYCENLPKS
jgi:hypothetical protein